jgi:hypothetical protein
MTLYTARLLCPLAERQDWTQPRLKYLDGSLYGEVIVIRHFLRRIRGA